CLRRSPLGRLRGQLSLESFLAHHGYHGPNEGELSARVWREDPAPIISTLEQYRTLPDDASPARTQAQRAAEQLVARDLVVRRLREAHLAVVLPRAWRGRPTPIDRDAAPTTSQTGISGLGARPGIVEGIAHVITDPGTAEVERGQILVAETTDPSWAAVMFVA